MSSGVHIFFGNGILPDPPVFEWPWSEIWIDGIEVTQAIQYYHSASHLTDSADQRKDNSARLIAGKAAWARVYVRTSKRYREIPGVTGTLTWTADWGSGIPLQGPWQLAAQPPGTVTARSNPPYATERGTLSYTLNFIIPAQLMFGWVFLDARVQTPSGANYTMSTSLDVGWRQTLWLGGIMVGYNGPANMAPNAPNLTLPAPTLNDLQNTAGQTLLMFPVENSAVIRSAGTITWNRPLTDAQSGPWGLHAELVSPEYRSRRTAER